MTTGLNTTGYNPGICFFIKAFDWCFSPVDTGVSNTHRFKKARTDKTRERVEFIYEREHK